MEHNEHSNPAITQFPSPIKDSNSAMNNEEKIQFVAKRFEEIMDALELDLTNDSLKRTPFRVAKMYVNEIFSGLDKETFPEIRFMENKYSHEKNPNMIFVKVHFTSFCEHHFVPMMGYAYVAYLPNKKLIGLSKIPRIVRYFAKRPQIQERLNAQIADSLSTLLETDDVAVSITAQHFCVLARGIEDQSGETTTNVCRGKFLGEGVNRKEFFEAISRSSQKGV